MVDDPAPRLLIAAPPAATSEPTTLDDSAAADGPPLVLGRYRLGSLLGAGAMGTVWRAIDTATGRLVAVKQTPARTTSRAARAAREADALRLAQVPGVVELLGDGVESGQQILVMGLVDGAPFPGTAARDWATLAPRFDGLLAVLGRVHALGVVHRDIKPSNVLVDEAGSVTLLDFGISRGEPLGATLTGLGEFVGTRRYAAPEQLTGSPIDGRADLYAVGVLLFEALTGAPPFTDAPEATYARLVKPAPSVTSRARQTPAVVAAVVDALLAQRPGERPATAEETRRRLGAHLRQPPILPLMAAAAVLEVVSTALDRGESVDVGGAGGSGRTRLVAAAAAKLVAEGWTVAWCRGGERPLESLRDVLGRATESASPIAEAEAALLHRLAGRTVLIADELDTVDKWSRSLIDRARAGGHVLRVVDGPGTVAPPRLMARDLLELFWGPDLILHHREDAAAELERRTDGLARRVVDELTAWTAAGLVSWEGDRLRVEPGAFDRIRARVVAPTTPVHGRPLEPALHRLLAWIGLAGEAARPTLLEDAMGLPAWEVDLEVAELVAQGAVRSVADGTLRAVTASPLLREWSDAQRMAAHEAIALALPPGAPGRVFHLAAAGDDAGLAVEVLGLTRTLTPRGEPGRAQALVELALPRLGLGPSPLHADLVVELARAALAGGLDDALAAAEVTLRRQRGADGLTALVRAWRLAQAGRLPEAAALVAPLPCFPDPEMDAWRQLVTVRATLALDPAAAERVVAAASHRQDTHGFYARRRAEWLGQIRFAQGRYAEAARLHEEVAGSDPDPRRRVAAMVNAAIAWRDLGDMSAAGARFTEAVEAAARGRLPGLEAHAWSGLRTVEHVGGQAGPPNLELVDAAERVGAAAPVGTIQLVEGAVAWAAGQPGLGQTLARRARDGFTSAKQPVGVLLARALTAACGGPEDHDALRAALETLHPTARFQGLMLLDMAEISAEKRRTLVAARLAGEVPSAPMYIAPPPVVARLVASTWMST